MSRWLSLLAILAAALAGCADPCANRVVRSAVSPDGRRVAAVFMRDCGATTRFSTQVSILPAGETPTKSGNVLIAETGTSRPAAWGGPEIGVRWLEPNRLVVDYPSHAEVLRRITDQAGVRIVFQARLDR